MTEVQQLTPAGPLDRMTASPAELTAQLDVVARRQEELAQVVKRLNASVAGFDQLQAYVEQLGQIVASLAEEVTALDRVTLQRRLDDLAEAVSAAAVPDRGAASWWPDLSVQEERAEALHSLGTWVDEVLRARHPEMYNQLGACWYLHPDILDELTALRAAWIAAYRGPAARPPSNGTTAGCPVRCAAAGSRSGPAAARAATRRRWRPPRRSWTARSSVTSSASTAAPA